MGLGPDLEQEGWNRDMVCCPDTARATTLRGIEARATER